jgi:hypothetical protein
LEEKLATLPKILKTYKVDKILGYRQLPPEKDGKILVGWEERNELPSGKDLIICKPIKKAKGDVTIATMEDYVNYFSIVAESSPLDFLKKIEDLDSEIKDLKLNLSFVKDMANLLVNRVKFSWADKEFFIIDEKIS